MGSKHLTKEQAYLAMYKFLDDYFQLTKSDDIASLLTGMSLLEDGGPVDPAIESEWDQAVEKAIEGNVNAGLVLNK